MSTISPERQWIRQHGKSGKQAALIFLGWKLDQLRLECGQVEVVDPDDVEPGTARLVPLYRDEHAQTWSVFVRDLPQEES